MFTRKFWKQAAERAVKTAAQALFGYAVVGGTLFNVWEVDWYTAAGVALGGAVLSVLTSLASLTVGDSNSPSAVQED